MSKESKETLILDIALRNLSAIIIPENSQENYIEPGKPVNNERSVQIVATFLNELHKTFGYQIGNPETIANLTKMDSQFLEVYLPMIQTRMRKHLLGDKQWNPMYRGFPTQVMEMEESHLYIYAIMHYWGLKFEVPYENPNPTLEPEIVSLKKLSVLTIKEFNKEFQDNIILQPYPYNESQLADISVMVENENITISELGDLSIKENIAFLSNKTWPIVNKSWFKTDTDILRLGVALSDGDISLTTRTKFRKFSRPERRRFMTMITGTTKSPEDMLRHRMNWLYFAERLHPGEDRWGKNYSVAKDKFNLIRNNPESYKTFNQKIEWNYINKEWNKLIPSLATRPGMLVRNVSRILRVLFDSNRPTTENTQSQAIQLLTDALISNVPNNVPVKSIMNAISYLHDMVNENIDHRIYIPRSSKTIATIQKHKTLQTNEYITQIRNTLEHCISLSYKNFPVSDANVLVDWDSIKGIAVPSSTKNVADLSKALFRGSRIPLHSDTSVIRMFTWWNNAPDGSRVDIDLSAVYFNEYFTQSGHVSWTELRDNANSICHSGDITNPEKNGAVEFIEVPLDKMDKKWRYMALSLISFTGQKFSEIENCIAGFMERGSMAQFESDDLFSMPNVRQYLNVLNPSTASIPIMFDLKTREIVIVDIAASKSIARSVSRSDAPTVLQTVKFTANRHTPQLKDILSSYLTFGSVRQFASQKQYAEEWLKETSKDDNFTIEDAPQLPVIDKQYVINNLLM